jgi:hypothetical protein
VDGEVLGSSPSAGARARVAQMEEH